MFFGTFFFLLWTSRIGAKSVFLNISRDILKNTPMAPLREVYWLTFYTVYQMADCRKRHL